MAVINVISRRDLLSIIQRIPGKAYTAVTDELTYVWLAPLVTSNHRHYFKYDMKDGDWEVISKALQEAGVMIVHGNLSFPRGG